MVLTTSCGHHEHSDHENESHPTESHEGHDHDHDHDHDAEKGEKHEGEISVSHEAEELAGVKVETMKKSDFNSVIKTGGRIIAPQGAMATVTARISGIVSFSDPNLAVGRQVSAGQSLFTVSAKGLEQSDGKKNASITLSLAEKELARANELIKENLISKKDYERIRHDYDLAKAESEGMSVKGAVSSVGASSPLGGYITSILVNPGQFVVQGEPLATVSQTRRLHLRADVSERQWDRLDEITGARIIVPGRGDETLELSTLNFKVVSKDMPDMTASHYVPVLMEFDNPGGLRNGSVAEIYLLGATESDVLSVPVSALTEEQGHNYVYVRVHPHVYKRIPVETGESDGLRVVIKKGLNEGDEVVTDGVHSVRLAEKSGLIPEGHTHNH